MGNKATQQPRSFNTIRRSQTKVRAKRRMTQRIVLLAMFATVALILISLLVLGGFAIANAIINAPAPPDQGDGTTPPAPVTDVVFIQTTIASNKVHEGELILVNNENKYPYPDSPAGVELLCIYDYIIYKHEGNTNYRPVSKDYELDTTTLTALHTMMSQYREFDDSETFAISSAYRDSNAQEALNSSVLPGHSDHHTGYCVAIQYFDRSNLEPNHWIYQNCYKFGFVVRYPEGKESITGVSDYKHCLRYVGVAHATYMHQSGLCFEEYIELLKNNYNSSAKRLSIAAADGITYEVYYTPASGQDVTTLDVPSNYSYTVSGDNRSGFIVTVKMTDPAA
ncbi:MAG: M15 family metallopeptidase [Clostridia bacterium]|nr:M15 family metallopeptidase [Clostridia bacterium]